MRKLICIFVIMTHIAGCATYRSQAVSFRPPSAYGNYLTTSGAGFGAEAFANPESAQEAFGYDVRRAGLLPVQLVVDNQSGQGIDVVAGQTFLIDDTNRYWKMLTTGEAIGRVEKAAELGPIGRGAGRGAVLGAMAGTALGLALGILSGHDAGTAALRGAALGGAGGAVIGGASKSDGREQDAEIITDLNDKRVEGRVFQSAALSHGFMFFPGEAASAKEVRVQVRFRASGEVKTLLLPLQPGAPSQILPSPAPTRASADG